MALPVGQAGEEAAEALLEQVHRQAMHAPLREVAESLQALLTGRITAYLAAVKNVKTISRWAHGEVMDVRVESECRLRAAFEIMLLLSRFDAPETVRAWFLGINPHLQDTAPVEFIHQGRFQEAMGAARSFAAYGANYG